MHGTDLESHDPGTQMMQCARCGHIEAMTSLGDCSICSGELRAQLPSVLDLGVDLSDIMEGVDAIPVHRILARYVQTCDIKFVLGNNPLTPEQVFQPECIMPVVSIEALRIWQSIERRPGQTPLDDDSLGIEFRQVEDGFFQYSAYPADIGNDLSSTLRMLVFVLAARRTLGLVEGQKIDLAPSVALWDKIDWGSDFLPDIPIPHGFEGNFHHREFPSKTRTTPKESMGAAASTPNPFASQGITNA